MKKDAFTFKLADGSTVRRRGTMTNKHSFLLTLMRIVILAIPLGMLALDQASMAVSWLLGVTIAEWWKP